MGWMKQLPTWMASGVMAVLFAVFWFGMTLITQPELALGARALVAGIDGTFYGIGMGFWLSRTRRGYGRVAQRPEFRRAVRHGTVPPEVGIPEWRQALLAHQRQYRPLRWAAPALYLPLTALAIVLAVTGQPLFWVAAGFFIAICIVTVVTAPRVLRNTDRMLADLDQREETLHVRR